MKIWKRVLGVTLSLVMSFELMPLALSEREQTAEDRLKEERAYSVLQRAEGTPLEQYEGYRFIEYCFELGAPELVPFQRRRAGELTSAERELLCGELALPELLFSEQLASLTVEHLVACYWYLSEREVPILQLVELAKDEQFFERQGIALLSEGSEPAFAPLQSEQKYYGAPFQLEENGSEQVAYTDGSLSINVTDLTLPGVNGLDLVISRRYDSSKARYYGQTGRLLHDCGETLELQHSATRYLYRQLSNGLLDQNGGYVTELSPIYEPATFEALSSPGRQRITATDGGFWIDEYRTEVRSCPVCSESVETGSSENEALPGTPEEGIYSLGAGWSLGFSHITTDGRTRTLHLADGRELPIEENDFNGLYWYMNGDLHLEFLEEGYQLTYQDGKVELFDQGGAAHRDPGPLLQPDHIYLSRGLTDENCGQLREGDSVHRGRERHRKDADRLGKRGEFLLPVEQKLRAGDRCAGVQPECSDQYARA